MSVSVPAIGTRDAKRLISRARVLYDDARSITGLPDRIAAAVRAQHAKLRADLVSQRLAQMPVADLSHFAERAPQGLRHLAGEGYTSVASVLALPVPRLQTIKGIGPKSLRRSRRLHIEHARQWTRRPRSGSTRAALRQGIPACFVVFVCSGRRTRSSCGPRALGSG